jgi:alpha-1,2-mannosyltransferase
VRDETSRNGGLLASRNKLILGLVFLFLYVPFVIDHGFLAASQPSMDLPSFYYASEAAFERSVSPYAPAAWQGLQGQLQQRVYPYLYPPPSLLFFAPLSSVPYEAAKTLVLVGNHLALLLLLYLLLFRIMTAARPWRRGVLPGASSRLLGWLILPLLVLYALRFQPVVVTLDHGQINLTVLVLLCLFWIGLRERRPGAVTALPLAAAILLKTYPALFLPLLVIRRRWRTAAWTGAYVAAMSALSWLVLPRQVWRDWLEDVLPTGGYANTLFGGLPPALPWNQSINGFAARLFQQPGYAWHTDPFLARAVPVVMALIIAGTLVWLAIRLSRRHETRYLNDEFVLVLVSIYLVAPLSWEHHLVFVLPAAMLALVHVFTGRTSWRTAVPVGLAAFVLAWPLEFLFRLPAGGLPTLLVSLKLYAVVTLWVYYVRRLVKVSRGETVDGAETGLAAPVS